MVGVPHCCADEGRDGRAITIRTRQDVAFLSLVRRARREREKKVNFGVCGCLWYYSPLFFFIYRVNPTSLYHYDIYGSIVKSKKQQV